MIQKFFSKSLVFVPDRNYENGAETNLEDHQFHYLNTILLGFWDEYGWHFISPLRVQCSILGKQALTRSCDLGDKATTVRLIRKC
jgi:hypothetical protein